MALSRWTFYDPVTLLTYEFEINPNDGGSPGYKKSFSYEKTTAPNGKVVVFEGRDEVRKMDFSGTLLSEEQYNAFVTWFEKRYQISLTDDLGRQYSILIESFEPSRVRAANAPWKHTYRVSATIVDW